MFCPHCKEYINKKSKICPNCGGDLSNIQCEGVADAKPKSLNIQPDKNTTRKKYYLAGGAVFIALLICLYGSNTSIKENVSSVTAKYTESKSPVEKADAISIDKSFSVASAAEITIKNAGFTDKLLSKPNSYFRYYKASEGKVYFVASGILKNLKAEKDDINNLVSIEAIYGDGQYPCIIFKDKEDRLSGAYGYIDPQQPENVKIAVELPAEAATNTQPIKLILGFSTAKYDLTVR